ncbi:MAG: hypothetical protein ACO3EE_07970 [Flavobacteriales bacterium]
MPFVDRLNLFTKSQYTADWITFSNEERVILDKVEKLETWEDVLRVTDELYAYSKDEQYEMEMQDFQDFEYGDDDEYSDDYSDFGDEYDSDYDEDSEVDGDSSKDGDDTDEETKKSKTSSEKPGQNGEGEDIGDEYGDKINRFKESAPSEKDTFIPECKTDESFRNNENLLLDEKSRPYVYADVPKPIYKNIITKAKRVHEQIAEYYYQPYSKYAELHKPRTSLEEAKKLVAEFKLKNERYIGLLAKEFEMRKAAKAFSKSKLSDTGDIDVAKLSSYRFDDNIFRKVMLTPKGKKHGLVLLLDKSGSMSGNMSGSIEQILVLSMFCRKVNIPFIVYGFGDSIESSICDSGLTIEQHRESGTKCFSDTNGELTLGQVYLREYLNSSMSNSEFSQSVRNLVVLKSSFESGRYGIGKPESEDLSNTPLIQAIFASAGIMNAFKRRHNLDLTSLIIVHDGDSDSINYCYETVEVDDYNTGKKVQIKRHKHFSPRYSNVIVRDGSNKFEMQLKDDNLLDVALHWFRKVTNSKVFGFFLTESYARAMKGALYNRYVYENGKSLEEMYKETRQQRDYMKFEEARTSLMKKFRSDKFLVSNNPGYNSFYLVMGGDELKTTNEELEIEGKVTSGKLKNAFMKLNKRKALNRILVSKFIQGIAA